MAVRKTNNRKTATRKTTKKPPSKPSSKGAGNRMPVSVVFRIFLLIVIIIAFFMLLPVIKNLRLNAKATETEQGTGNSPTELAREQGTENKEQVTEKREEGKKPQSEKSADPVQPSSPKMPEKEPEKKPQTEKPAPPAQPSTAPAQPSTPPAPVSTPPVKLVETRDRSIYLIHKSNMMLVKVNRNLNATLTDSINALLAGPTPDEIMRDIESLIPEGSRLLSPVKIEGSTAVLDFNQEFRYNPRGREGCAAQIKQIVWTATEFSTVKDVQFLIEGQRVDFLSEGVAIRNPIGR